MPGLLSTTAFIVLNTVLFPVSLAGYVSSIATLFAKGRGTGVSATAQGPLSARWSEHELGTRTDEAASRILISRPQSCRKRLAP